MTTPPTEAELAQARAELEMECGFRAYETLASNLITERAKYNRAEQRAREAEESRDKWHGLWVAVGGTLEACERRADRHRVDAERWQVAAESLHADVAAAEQRVAEAERERDTWKRNHDMVTSRYRVCQDIGHNDRKALKERAEAAEQRCRELQAALENIRSCGSFSHALMIIASALAEPGVLDDSEHFT